MIALSNFQRLQHCGTCIEANHNLRVCSYLHDQRKVFADDMAQVILERCRKLCRALRQFRKLLRVLAEKESSLYEYLGGPIRSEICWEILVNENSSNDSSTRANYASSVCIPLECISKIGI